MQGKRSAPARRETRNYSYPPQRRSGKKRSSPRKRLLGLFLLLALIALLAFALDMIIALGIGTPKFYNVCVNGVSLRGMTREEGFAYFDALESTWQDTSYELYYGENSWTFSPATLNAALNEEEAIERAWNYGHVGTIFERKSQVQMIAHNPAQLESEITYDQALMDAFISTLQQAIDREPVDALIAADVDRPRVVSGSSDGAQLQTEETIELLLHLLIYGSEETRIELPVEILKPALTTETANAMLGSGEPIAQVRTSIVGSSSNRKNNVRVALSRFNGLRLDPGQQISFNAVALERTLANGYKEGIEYSEGESTSGIGGGVCQASTTLYTALLQAGVTIVQRSPHSMTVDYVPASCDAAVTDTGSKDLVFRNDSENPIFIYTTVTDANAYVYIYGARPAYRYEFRPVIIQDNIEATSESVRVDTTGEYATYTDEKVLVTEGRKGRISELYRDSYDWDTGELVATELISHDVYTAGKNIYYVGTQVRLATDVPQAGTTLPPW